MISWLFTNQLNLSRATPTGNYPNCSHYTKNQPGNLKWSQMLTPLRPKLTLFLFHTCFCLEPSWSHIPFLQTPPSRLPWPISPGFSSSPYVLFLSFPAGLSSCPHAVTVGVPPDRGSQPLFFLLYNYPHGALPTSPVTEGPSPFLIPTSSRPPQFLHFLQVWFQTSPIFFLYSSLHISYMYICSFPSRVQALQAEVRSFLHSFNKHWEPAICKYCFRYINRENKDPRLHGANILVGWGGEMQGTRRDNEQ